MNRISVEDPLFKLRDMDGYKRFVKALAYDDKRNLSNARMKHLFFDNDSTASDDFSRTFELYALIGESHEDGTFVKKFLAHKEHYLSAKAIKKFFKQ